MVMRMREPEEVRWRGGEVDGARVAAVDGPYRVSGEWWDRASAYDRSYYWLTLAGGERMWIYRDHRDGRHYLHGVAD
jgi:hypothetical protein